jgi:beta-glucosidase
MREVNAQMVMQVTYRVDQAPQGPVALELGAQGKTASVPLNGVIAPADGQWHTLRVPLSCFAARGLQVDKIDQVFGLAARRLCHCPGRSAPVGRSERPGLP